MTSGQQQSRQLGEWFSGIVARGCLGPWVVKKMGGQGFGRHSKSELPSGDLIIIYFMISISLLFGFLWWASQPRSLRNIVHKGTFGDPDFSKWIICFFFVPQFHQLFSSKPKVQSNLSMIAPLSKGLFAAASPPYSRPDAFNFTFNFISFPIS